ncbi:MAG TPA: ABC transporter permease, partial [Polyangiaceae bacterium]|nr:ABC transporter permease [Polyangiaceae bacterium]
MKLWQTLPLALKALGRNKTRSLLTTLGIVIGVASVISMVAVGEGARARVEGVFATMGTNMLIVLSGSTSSGGVMGGFGSMPTLTWDDLAAIRTQARAVRSAAPAASARITILSDQANWTTGVVGTSPDYFSIRAWRIALGSAFGPDEVDTGAKVIVLGQTASDKLFGPGIDPIGRTVRLRAIPFVVIGVLERKGQSPMGSDYDDVDSGAKVIVLGQTAADKLFAPGVSPIGRVVRLRSTPFQVVGVLE